MVGRSNRKCNDCCRLIAVTGGIGSGKSTVCRMLRIMGYDVYDCDSRAAYLMDNSDEIKQAIRADVCMDAIVDGKIDRIRLAEKVFNDVILLNRLNGIVHGAVRDDILLWRKKCGKIAFVETALLYQSGIDRIVDAVWEVSCPESIRIERVMLRNGMSVADVKKRIDLQNAYIPHEQHPNVKNIDNDGFTPVLPIVMSLIGS